MITIQSNNYGHFEISGHEEQAAADWLTDRIKGASKSTEILLSMECSKSFGCKVHPTNESV